MRAAQNLDNGPDTSLYDTVPYPHYVFPQTSPDNLAVLSILYGLDPVAPSGCRYLELGCGNGTNIAAFASRYPDSRFVGIDLAENHISSARQISNDLALDNVEFIAADLMDLDPGSLGRFDFVVAHGLFSWVPDAVRTRILEVMKQCVAPNGVGYISYNALPGCHLRKIGWDLLRIGTRNIEDPKDKLEASMNLASFVARESAEGSTQNLIYQLIADELTSRRPENVLHDDLSELNRPFYFFEFVELLKPQGLKFLCEADPRSNGSGNLSRSARDELDRMTSDPTEHEQFVDFLDFASFRRSIICHVETPSLAAPTSERLRELYCEWSLRPGAGDENAEETDSTISFKSDAASIETDHPLTGSVLLEMSASSPRPIVIGDTIDRSILKIAEEAAEEDIENEKQALEFLLNLYQSGLIRLFTEPPPIDSVPGDKPQTHRFARWQAMNGLDTFTTLLGENIAFGNDIVRLLIMLLDGTRDRPALISEVLDRLQLSPDQVEQVRASIPQIVGSNIEQLRRLGVFVR